MYFMPVFYLLFNLSKFYWYQILTLCKTAVFKSISIKWRVNDWPLFMVNTLRPRQNGRHFPNDIFNKCIFVNENVWISIKTSLSFVPRGPINNILTLVQIMAWRRPGDKPLSEPMLVCLLTHICVTRPQWVNTVNSCTHLSYCLTILSV